MARRDQGYMVFYVIQRIQEPHIAMPTDPEDVGDLFRDQELGNEVRAFFRAMEFSPS
jgi:hypothetical protein